MIRPLDIEVRSRLRSGVAITSISQCVEELVLNSLDAGASCISVRVDIPGFRVQVVDNGCGIKSEDLALVGVRHATSKCHSLKDLEKLSFHGFRGEALASIRDISGVLEIVSRHKSTYKTLCKIFQNGKPLQVTESCVPRSITGTTVDVHDMFASLPVRRKLISDTLDFERIRHRIASIALIHPEVAFSLLNEATGAKCLQTHKCQSILSTFSQLFGNSKSKSLKEVVNYQHEQFKVAGYVSLDSHHSKSLQFLYINGRLILKTRIHKLVNALIAKSTLIKTRTSVVNEGRSDRKERSSPQTTRGADKYGVFVLNVECCVSEYDICLEPSKTLVEFQDWEGVLRCVEKCLELFLERENLVVKQDSQDMGEEENRESRIAEPGSAGATVRTLSEFEYQTCSEKSGKTIETGNIQKSLHSSTVFRRKERMVQGCVEESQPCGDKLDSDSGKAEYSEKEESEGATNQHQENSFSEAEYSEFVDDSETVQRPQKAGELMDLDVFALQQPTEKTKVDDIIVCQQHCFIRKENSCTSQGTILSESSDKQSESEVLTGDETKTQCHSCNSTKARRNISKECVLGELNQVNASSSKDCDVSRNIGKAVSSFAHKFTQRLGRELDKEYTAAPLQSFRYNKHSKRSIATKQVSSTYAQAACTSLESVCSYASREGLIFGPEKRAESRFTCRAPVLSRPAFTSPNPIMLPKPYTRKRTQEACRGSFAGGYFSSNRKYISLKRTHKRTPRHWPGRKQTSKRNSADTTDESDEQGTGRDDRRADLGSGLSERLINTSRFSPQRSHEQTDVVAEDVGKETCSGLSDAFPGVSSGRCNVSGLCKSPPSVRVEENDLPVDSLLAQMEKADFTTHNTKVYRMGEGDSDVMCIDNERAGMRSTISTEEGNNERTSQETINGDIAESTDSSEVSVPGPEKLEANKDSTQEEGEGGDCGTSSSTEDPQVAAVCGQVLSRVHCPMDSCLTERTERCCRDSESTRSTEESSGVACGLALCDKPKEEGPLQKRNIGTRDAVSSRVQISSSEQKAAVSNESESLPARGEEVVSSIVEEWTCTFDASRGRTLYINLRTGNSSFDPPVELPAEDGERGSPRSNVAQKQGLEAARQIPHSAAPHISFSCSPWMPREGRRRFVTVSPVDVDRAADSEGAENHRSLVLEMFDEHLSEQFSDMLCKWADTRALKEFENRLKDGSAHVSEMFQKWTNPVFAAPGKSIMSLHNPSADRNQVRVHSVIHPYRFSKDMLDKMVVINQLDQKFIVCVLTRESSGDGGLVVIVDQHAAHERIRLEKLNADLFEGEPDTKYGKRNLKSSAVSPPLEITLSPNEARLVKSYRTEMERIGLRFTFGPPSETSNEVALVVGIPSVFVERELSEVKRGRPSLAIGLVKELITEHIEHMMSAAGVAHEIPKAISRIVSSQACHGAVKFGEPLGVEECEALIRSLAKCDLPFQCAHGRPSVVPLVDLDLLGTRCASEEPSHPRLHKLAKLATSCSDLAL